MLSVQLFSCFGEDEVASKVEEVVNLFIIRYVFHHENLVFDRNCQEKSRNFENDFVWKIVSGIPFCVHSVMLH